MHTIEEDIQKSGSQLAAGALLIRCWYRSI